MRDRPGGEERVLVYRRTATCAFWRTLPNASGNDALPFERVGKMRSGRARATLGGVQGEGYITPV